MRLAVLLFLTGVASAYPLKPAQESQLVPRDQPQPHCLCEVDGRRPVAASTQPMWTATCALQPGVVGILLDTSLSLKDFRKSWGDKKEEPSKCVIPRGSTLGEKGYCFVLKSVANPPANTHRKLAPRPGQGDTAPSSHGPLHPSAAHPPANPPHSAAPPNSQHPPPQAPHRPASTNSSKDFPTAISWSGLTYPSSGKQ